MKPASQRCAPVPIDEKRLRAAIVDEFGGLDNQVRAFAPTAARHETLRNTIKAWFPNLPGDQAVSVSGDIYRVDLSVRQQERSITSMLKVWKALGKAKFLEACSMTLKALESALGGEEAAEPFVERGRTGHRKVTAVLIDGTTQQKAA